MYKCDKKCLSIEVNPPQSTRNTINLPFDPLFCTKVLHQSVGKRQVKLIKTNENDESEAGTVRRSKLTFILCEHG